MPRFGLAARAGFAEPGTGGAVCFGLFDPTAPGRQTARRSGRRRPRLHRPARLGRGLSSRRRLGGTRSDVGVADGRRAFALGGQSRFRIGGPDQRCGRSMRDRVRIPHAGHAHSRRSARHPSVQRRAVAANSAAWANRSTGNWTPATSGSRWGASRRSFPSTTWTARMEHGGTRSKKATDGGRPVSPIGTRFATGPLLHFGQGKWYPGESLPRWALGCYWRADGEPIWNDPALIAEDEPRLRVHATRKRTLSSRSWRTGSAWTVARDGGLRRCLVLLVEGTAASRQRRSAQVKSRRCGRARTARRASSSRAWGEWSDSPCRCEPESNGTDVRWQSSAWMFRTEHMYLIPGDSPMGFRLPLDSLLWAADKEAPQLYERDPVCGSATAADSRSHTDRPSLERPGSFKQNGARIRALQWLRRMPQPIAIVARPSNCRRGSRCDPRSLGK